MFVDWMDDLELSISSLKQESLSTPEYRKTLEKFQVYKKFPLFSNAFFGKHRK